MVSMVLTSYGGHIGFVEGLTIHKSNYMERLFSQFAKGIFELVEKDQLKEILKEACSWEKLMCNQLLDVDSEWCMLILQQRCQE